MAQQAELPVIFLMGPTASGKTGLAVELVQALGLEIISVDSALIYKGMDIGSAKPDRQTLARAPHRLLDFLDPAESYSAAQFAADARREIADIHAAGNIPLLVGGTMLYFRALQQGLSEMPPADAALRAELDTQAQKLGWPAMHARLAEADPQAASRIHPNDAQRIQRALELVVLTGEGPTAWHERGRAAAANWPVIKLALSGGARPLLRERIAQRFQAMMEQGFLDEVRGLYARGDLSLDSPSVRCVGYRQLWQHLDGKFDLSTAIDKGITASRQLAKRQMTWLRAERDLHWLDESTSAWMPVESSSVASYLKGLDLGL